MSSYRIFEGDANLIIDQFKDKSIDCIFTSPEPPTKDTEVASLVQFFAKAKRVISDLGCVWINLKNFQGDNKGMLPFSELFVLAMRQEGWAYLDDLVWHRSPHMRGKAGKPKDTFHFYADTEHFYRFAHDRLAYFNDRLGLHNTNIFVCPAEEIKADEFKSGFPVKAAEHCIKISTEPAAIVLDPFCGTGTTGVASMNLGRHFIGCERYTQDGYISKIESRLNKFGLSDKDNSIFHKVLKEAPTTIV